MNTDHDPLNSEPEAMPSRDEDLPTEREGSARTPKDEGFPPEMPTRPAVPAPPDDSSAEEHFALQEGLTPLVSSDDVLMALGGTHPLPPLHDQPLEFARRLYFGAARDIGRVRSSNEDTTVVFHSVQQSVQDNPAFSLFLVADGAGGHTDGEFASTLVGRVILQTVSEQIYMPMLLQNVNPETAEPLAPITEVLVDAVHQADSAIRKEVPGSGTTLTAAVIIGDLAHIVHVGDSRAYLVTGEEDGPAIQQITRDHSVAKRLQEIGQITAAEATNHPEASRLWKIMGLSENLEPDITTRRLPANCHLVLCSDGLWNMVPEADIAAAVLSADTPQTAANVLVAAANANGGVDNISVVVVRVP